MEGKDEVGPSPEGAAFRIDAVHPVKKQFFLIIGPVAFQ